MCVLPLKGHMTAGQVPVSLLCVLRIHARPTNHNDMYIYIYTYIYTYKERESERDIHMIYLSLCMCIYIYICMYVSIT